VAALAGGRKSVVALKEGLLPHVVRGIEVAEGEHREGVTLFLGAGARVSGRVTDGEERPVPEARVTLLPALGPPRETTTNEGGEFSMGGVPSGPYALRVTAQGFSPFELASIEAPAESLEITLTRGGGLMGRVLEEDSSEPVPDATVRALRMGEPSELDPERPVYREVARVRASTASGTFALGDLPEGSYRLEAWSAGGLFGFVDRLRVGGDERAAGPVTVRAYAGWSITGRVVRAGDGLPVEGATVAVRGVGDDPGPHSAVTDGSGGFSIRSVPPGFHTLIVVARDFAPRLVDSVEVKRAADTQVPDIEITSGATIRGLVMGPDGLARSGAEIRLASADLPGERRAVTDEVGTFHFEHVAPGTWLLVSEDPLAGPGGRRSERLIEVEEGDDIVLAIGSGDGTALTGRITSSGAPVAHAVLTALRVSSNIEEDRRVYTTRSDADGNYMFPDLAPGDLLLLVAMRGSELAPVRILVRVLPGPVMIHDLVLPDSGVEGVVTDLDTGRPLAGVTLYLLREAGGSEGTFLEMLTRQAGATRSEGDGSFRFTAVAPGEYRIDAFRDGYGQTVSDPLRVTPGGFTPARVDMPPAGVLTGRVLSDDERPVTDARVAFIDARGTFATELGGVDVDSEGRFRVDSLRTGRYTVEARAPGYAVARKAGVEVFPGGHPDVELRLSPEGRLEISVYGPGGIPVEGARVSVADFWGYPVTFPEPPVGILTPFRDPARTGKDGRVLVKGLPAGIYLVSASLPGRTGEPSRVRVLDGEITRGAIVLLPK
jgi:protocatechuate 3,4-dioxygenase beta subunit